MAITSARARHDVALSRRRRFFGPLTRLLNPLIRRLAGGSHTPLFSLVYHQGRRSGRTYATPVGLGSTGETFLIPLTFGVDADWCRNVLAAGRCLVRSHGRTYVAVQPEVVNDVSVLAELSAAFDPLQRQAFRIMGTHTFLRLRNADRESPGGQSGERLPVSVRVLRPLLPVFGKIHQSLYRRTGGAIGGRISGNPILLLSTTGRRTGRHRTTPLGYISDGDNFVIIAGAGGSPKHPAWWHNLRTNPEAYVQVGWRILKVSATAATPEESRRILRQNPEQSVLYEAMQRAVGRPIPVVILRPTGGADCPRGRRSPRDRPDFLRLFPLDLQQEKRG
jgi:F420H(2)-dependent quinone reductase